MCGKIEICSTKWKLIALVHLSQAEADYYREVHLLDLKYQSKYDEINKKRDQVTCIIPDTC